MKYGKWTVSALWAGAYTATLYVVIEWKGVGVHPSLSERGWACTPHPHQPGLIFPSWWNIRQKSAIATLCVLCAQHCKLKYVYSVQRVEQPRAEEGRPQAPQPVHRSRCPGPGGRTHDQVRHAFGALMNPVQIILPDPKTLSWNPVCK